MAKASSVGGGDNGAGGWGACKGQRVDYDRIAERYDRERNRGKEPDRQMQGILGAHPGGAGFRTLDIGCGTGSQLAANRPAVPLGHLVGLDLSAGMLRQAAAKSLDIDWVRGDGARLPFAEDSFDYVTSQFSFHHVRDKREMIGQVFRVLQPGGRFVITNIEPRGMPGWLVYRYFPSAFELDARDFMTRDEIGALLGQAGFDPIRADVCHLAQDDDLREFEQAARLRVTSQIAAVSDAEYRRGMRRLARDLAAWPPGPAPAPSELCLLEIVATKPPGDSNGAGR